MINEAKNLLQRIYAKNSVKVSKDKLTFSNNKRKKIYYMLVPTHGNIGDQAIAEASLLFFKDYFSEYEVVIIDFSETYKLYKEIKKNIRHQDLIFLHGGGNMGNLYPWEEYSRRFVIKNFHNNKIISMPQTIDFRNTKNGRKELRKTIKVYNSNPNLTLIAREKKSFDLMKRYFPNINILLNPDIVFHLWPSIGSTNIKRETIMSCIRSDKESISDNNVLLKLQNQFPEILISDTVVAHKVSDKLRQVEVKSMLNQFMRAKVVITDRMHGMVFSAITGTPCVVTKSLDYKVVGTYQWIKDLPYIHLVEELDSEQTFHLVEQLSNEEIKSHELNFDKKYFKDLRVRMGI